jgi:hypothetical protein
MGTGEAVTDLFVFKGRERFFVEVKWKDHFTDKQRVTFPLIEANCGVRIKIARIYDRGLPSKKRAKVSSACSRRRLVRP